MCVYTHTHITSHRPVSFILQKVFNHNQYTLRPTGNSQVPKYIKFRSHYIKRELVYSSLPCLSCNCTLLLSALDAGAGPLSHTSSTIFNATFMLGFAHVLEGNWKVGKT